MIRLVLPGLIVAAIMSGQSLSVAESQTDGTTPGVLSIEIASPKGSEPVALQLEISIPPAVVVALSDIKAAPSAALAGKSVACAKKTDAEPMIRYACILMGGKAPIPNGAIVLLRYRIAGDVHSASIRVPIENVVAVSADLKRIEIPNTEGIINIH